MIGFLFRQRLREIRRYFANGDAGRMLTAVLLLVVGAGIAVGVYGLLEAGLSAMAANEFLSAALPFFVYEMFFLVVFGLVFFSAMISGVFSLFRGGHDFWALASPSYGQLVIDKCIAVAGVSLWPLVVLVVPALVAVQSVHAIGIGGVVFSFLAVVLLGVVGVGLALVALFVLARLVSVLKHSGVIANAFKGLVVGVGVLLAGVLYLLWLPFSSVNLSELFAVTNLDIAQAGTERVAELFAYYPSHLPAQILAGLQDGVVLSESMPLVWLCVMVGLTLAVLYYLAGSYLSLWQLFQEGQHVADSKQKSARAPKVASRSFAGGPVRGVINKEWIMFFRNTRNQLWAVFLLGLWLVVTGFDAFMQSELATETLFGLPATEAIQVFQLLVVVYFVASLAVRFVFPNFSLEAENAWNLLSSPVSRTKLFWTKAVFFGGLLGLLTLFVSIIHLFILGIGLGTGVVFLVMAVTAAITVALIGLALGARFPNFDTSDPQKLSTTLPGLSFVIVSMLYGGVASYVLYLTFLTGQLLIAGLFVLGSALLAFGFCRLATAKLDAIEFMSAVQS